MTAFDVCSVTLLIATLALFLIRYLRTEPPVLPYLVIASTCATVNFLSDAGAGFEALILLIAASFLFLGCLLRPESKADRAPLPGQR